MHIFCLLFIFRRRFVWQYQFFEVLAVDETLTWYFGYALRDNEWIYIKPMTVGKTSDI